MINKIAQLSGFQFFNALIKMIEIAFNTDNMLILL
jgi:hypothetical protein